MPGWAVYVTTYLAVCVSLTKMREQTLGGADAELLHETVLFMLMFMMQNRSIADALQVCAGEICIACADFSVI